MNLEDALEQIRNRGNWTVESLREFMRTEVDFFPSEISSDAVSFFWAGSDLGAFQGSKEILGQIESGRTKLDELN
jgi:hypothetical protein